MKVSLILKRADGRDRAFDCPASALVIGRDALSDLRVPMPGVAARQCEIRRDGTEIWVRHLGGGGETRVNGEVVDRCRLRDGDALAVGPVEFAVRVVERSDREVTIRPTSPRSVPAPHSAPGS